MDFLFIFYGGILDQNFRFRFYYDSPIPFRCLIIHKGETGETEDFDIWLRLENIKEQIDFKWDSFDKIKELEKKEIEK